MMSDQYEQVVTTTDAQNNVTYIQFVPQSQILFCKEENQEEYEENDYEENEEREEDASCEEALEEESYIEEDTIGEVEILESIVVEPKKNQTKTSEHHVTKKLVQVKDSGKPKGRKRVIPDQTRAIRKIRANTNKPYVNAKGQEVKPKEFDDFFVCTCPKKCTDKLSLRTRRQIFNMFWNIGSYEGRCAFLLNCVNEAPKKRTYTKNKETSRRKMTRKYFLKGFEICKTTFTKTLMISNSRIDVVLQKSDEDRYQDERGKKKAGHGFSEEKREKIISHIKDNFQPDSSIRGLWALYTTSNADDPVSESYYKRMFYENFNLKTRKVVIKKEVKTDPKVIETELD